MMDPYIHRLLFRDEFTCIPGFRFNIDIKKLCDNGSIIQALDI